VKQLLTLKWRLLPLVIAAAVLAAPLVNNYWNRYQASSAAHAADEKLQQAETQQIEGTPNRILIPSLSIDLPVVSQSYSPVTKSWPVAAGLANYATESVLVNNTKGETLIYGHNNRSVFGPILKMKPSDIVYVYTDNGHIFKYSYVTSQYVTPTKTEIFAAMAEAPAGLELITCNGPNFEYRHLMSLKLLQAT
jgi:LPXTG-site transpeptidase (sortase) family protein